MNEGMCMMRRIWLVSAAALCIGLLAWSAVGCFGSGGESTDTTPPETVPSSGTTVSTLPVVTTEASGLVEMDGRSLPAAFVNSLTTKPILVLFYVPGQVDDEKVLKAVRELQTVFSSYTFLIYDYRMPAAYGDLAELLNVDYAPEITLIDRSGEPQWVWSGYVDKASLNQTLLNIGRY
jgi:hypothetical protein